MFPFLSVLSHFVSVSLHIVPFCVHSVRFHVRFVSVRSTFYREKDKTDSDTPDCPFSCSFYPFVSFCVRFVRNVSLIRVRLPFYRETDKTDSDTPSNKYAISLTWTPEISASMMFVWSLVIIYNLFHFNVLCGGPYFASTWWGIQA